MSDFLTKRERSSLMSRIRSKDTGIERTIFREIRAAKIHFRRNDRRTPGSPDLVFPKQKIAVFLDGGFWHGYQFKKWSHRLRPFWRNKILTNIKRDNRNRRKLRRQGWVVLRFWQHQIQKDPHYVAFIILDTYLSRIS